MLSCHLNGSLLSTLGDSGQTFPLPHQTQPNRYRSASLWQHFSIFSELFTLAFWKSLKTTNTVYPYESYAYKRLMAIFVHVYKGKSNNCVMLLTCVLRYHPLHGPDQPALIPSLTAHSLLLWHHLKFQHASSAHARIHALSHTHTQKLCCRQRCAVRSRRMSFVLKIHFCMWHFL